jgi:hypothetical protein
MVAHENTDLGMVSMQGKWGSVLRKKRKGICVGEREMRKRVRMRECEMGARRKTVREKKHETQCKRRCSSSSS